MATIEQLKYVLAVYQVGHFGRAAKQCMIAQPSLSAQILKLESDIGYALFDRSKKPVKVTPLGELFIKKAQQVLHAYSGLLALSETAHPVQGVFRLGIIPTVAPYILPLFLPSFTEANPDIQLIITELQTDVIIKQLKSDILDAGLLATPLSNPSGLYTTKLFYELFHVFLSPTHALNSHTQIAESDLSDVWLLDSGHCLRNQAMHICSNIARSNRIDSTSFSSNQLETLLNMVRRGHGCTLIPDLATHYLSESDRVYLKPFEPPAPHREISLVYARQNWQLATLQALGYHITVNLPATCYQQLSDSPNIIPTN